MHFRLMPSNRHAYNVVPDCTVAVFPLAMSVHAPEPILYCNLQPVCCPVIGMVALIPFQVGFPMARLESAIVNALLLVVTTCVPVLFRALSLYCMYKYHVPVAVISAFETVVPFVKLVQPVAGAVVLWDQTYFKLWAYTPLPPVSLTVILA